MSDSPKFPSPDEIQKNFEEFVKGKFGDQVKVVTQQVTPGQMPFAEPPHTEQPEDPSLDSKSFDMNFHYKPRDIKNYLDRFVIKQDEAKKALAIAVCDHYNHVRQCHENVQQQSEDYSKQNVMVLGPTGVGKTYLIKQIAKLIGVPFVKADATRFSETGYVGSNVDDLIQDLVSQADGNIEMAQYGIVYLDEADKLAASGTSGGKDISGRGVQFGLLKLMEETEVDLQSGNDMRSQMQAFMEFQKNGKMDSKVINTKHILFIISGAFSGLVDIIKERLNQNAIGFNSHAKTTEIEDNEYFQHADTQDFIDYGFEPEFVGRLPIRVACQNLNKSDLYSILKNSEGSIIRQYTQAFAAYGIDASFTDEALQLIAELAEKEKTGARALMTVTEKILRPFKYELPSLKLKKFEINAAVVENPTSVLGDILANYTPTDMHPMANEVGIFADRFFEANQMTLLFTEDAVNEVCILADDQKIDPKDLCVQIFKNYEHGLKLIEQNIGQSQFTINKETIVTPRETLEKWIKDSYKKLDEKKLADVEEATLD